MRRQPDDIALLSVLHRSNIWRAAVYRACHVDVPIAIFKRLLLNDQLVGVRVAIEEFEPALDKIILHRAVCAASRALFSA